MKLTSADYTRRDTRTTTPTAIADPDLGTPQREARVTALTAKAATLGLQGKESAAVRVPRSNLHRCRAVIGPDGTRYPTVGRAAKAMRMSTGSISQACERGYFGLRYEDQEEMKEGAK